jgi:uncharacterized protein YbjT (DUF2867 family)
MSESQKTILVVGSTGSIGHLVVEEAVRKGYAVRALVRTPSKARLDGVRDTPNQPLEDEPQGVLDDLCSLSANRR